MRKQEQSHLLISTSAMLSAHLARMHTHPFNGPLSGTTQVSRYQKGKTNLDFTGRMLFQQQRQCNESTMLSTHLAQNEHTHTFNGPFFRDYPGKPVPERQKPICILLKQETVSCSGISWAMCKSAPRSRQITMPAPHHSVFYRPYALPAAQPTASKH